MTLILTHSDIASVLDRDEVRKAVERAHLGLALGDCQNPAPRSLALPEAGTALPMAASGQGLATVKLLCDVPVNRERGLPAQRSTVMVSCAVTGECLAILDGRAVTAVRTAAASAVATDHLARPSASVLGLVGAGNLAAEHARAIAAVRDVERIVVTSRTTATVESFRSAVSDLGIPVIRADTAEEVFADADIICTLTPAREPVVQGRWFRPGQHINAVGAPPRPDHREIDSVGMSNARLVVDSIPTVLAKSGGVLVAIAEGALTDTEIHTELGHIIAGLAPGRISDDDITLFESVGIGLQDLATAGVVVEHAIERGIGTVIDLGS
ncbi:ornithine cyclodeaminase [Mycolicibacterium cosmeticum]|uniref:Alanine dehydrogenase n=1 Tax=Mycolicibacterium cosmeticum TaxID=258533 RepID=W9BLU5_MYCCO|nr:ornithine cyclodeaminase family protein [Mycolicibacterium cosmeticum]TLH81593.1 ornithine cyclodeaminase [Mycolicibacterium cosmeticum]CDO10260.1 alanine dehydrogenase [Mycolicibacterium cosmeticum]